MVNWWLVNSLTSQWSITAPRSPSVCADRRYSRWFDAADQSLLIWAHSARPRKSISRRCKYWGRPAALPASLLLASKTECFLDNEIGRVLPRCYLWVKSQHVSSEPQDCAFLRQVASRWEGRSSFWILWLPYRLLDLQSHSHSLTDHQWTSD